MEVNLFKCLYDVYGIVFVLWYKLWFEEIVEMIYENEMRIRKVNFIFF